MPVLRSTSLFRAGFAHAFPERAIQDAELLETLGVDRIVQAKQVHGRRVIDAYRAQAEEADAIVARAAVSPRPVAIGVRVADCVPVLIGDDANGDVAAVHAGWRGVVAGVVGAAVEQLAASTPLAAIGPCIGPCCFEVGRDVAESIARAVPGADVVVRRAGDKAYVDLRAAVRAQLRTSGVPDSGIEDVAGCTKHEPRFWSFRRDGAAAGRMLAAIATRPPR